MMQYHCSYCKLGVPLRVPCRYCMHSYLRHSSCQVPSMVILIYSRHSVTAWEPLNRLGVRGHLPWKVVQGCAVVITPFFQDNWRSLAYTNLPSMHCSYAPPPPISILEKLHFQQFWAKISALKMQISNIFVPKTPIFYRKSAP